MVRTLTLLLLLAGSLCPAPCHGQQTLPDEMVAGFASSGTFAEQLWLPATAPGDEIYGRVEFENAGPAGSVSFTWDVARPAAAMRTFQQELSVPFRPTAVARRAGTSSTLYVVGWSDETGCVLVETWTFTGEAVGSAPAPEGGGTISTFVMPTIARARSWSSDACAVQPIWDAVCQTYGDALLMLESGPVTRILSLDLARHVVSTLQASSTPGFEQLAGHRMFSAGQSPSGAFVCLTERRRPWDSGRRYSEPYTLLVLTDANTDGSFESTAFMENGDFWTLYPTPWNMRYGE